MFIHTAEKFRKKNIRELNMVFLSCESWTFFYFSSFKLQILYWYLDLNCKNNTCLYVFLILKIWESIWERKKNRRKTKTQLQGPENHWCHYYGLADMAFSYAAHTALWPPFYFHKTPFMFSQSINIDLIYSLMAIV